MRHILITFATFIVFVIGLLTINLVMAQEEVPPEEIGFGQTQEISDPALKISLSETKQIYPSKKFGLTLTIDSQISSNRVGLTWNFPTDLFLVEGNVQDTITVVSGQRTTFTKYFTPRKEYKFAKVSDKKVELGVRVNTFVAERNYLSSTKIVVDFNNDLEKLPVDSDYSRDKIVATVFNWGIFISIVAVIIGIIVVAVRKFRSYLNSPEEEA